MSLPLSPGIQWPPPSYEVPLVEYDPGFWESFSDSVKASMGSVSNMGFALLGFIISVFLIFSIVMYFINYQYKLKKGVFNNQLRRDINKLDRSINYRSIFDERVANMEINHDSKKLFRQRNPKVDLDEKLYQRHLSYFSDEMTRGIYFQRDFANRSYRMNVSSEAEMIKRNASPDLNVDERVYQVDVSRSARRRISERDAKSSRRFSSHRIQSIISSSRESSSSD